MALVCTSVTHTIPVPDAEAGRAWYAQLFDREPDVIPAPAVYEWKLRESVWLQVTVGAPAMAGSGQLLRIGIAGLDPAVARFVELGGTATERIEIPDLITIQDLEDPFGNALSFYEEVG